MVIVVPPIVCIKSARVITTFFTPAAMASNEFSNLGIIPPLITPSATYFSKSSGVNFEITLSSSFSIRQHSFFLETIH